eukprot:CAMPEP_0178421704 /NCGR_PEP_ID=MMETSP0689_2-20121128/26785_1 /TAXON_ID=160604 /ORGANISM="Amphidinium massartii, Strain CS-259" /LENGTH=174 /DNA_ID=CAMNT_0020043225 /DNA_START=120 /DNA_END=641 /DNA_ORIENTATION=+
MERSCHGLSALTLDDLRRPVPPRMYHSCAMFGDKYVQSYVDRLLMEASDESETTTGTPSSEVQSESGDDEPKIIPLEDVQEGRVVGGVIVRMCPVGVFVDIGAEVCGFLPWRAIRGVPRRYVKKGEALGNLAVAKVDLKRKRLTLKFFPLIGRSFPSDEYEDIENQVGEWAFLP